MAEKKKIYISAELDWAEQKLQEWKAYIDNNPISELQDRIEWKPTSKGGMMPMVVASIEAQIKSLRDTLKEYFALLEVVNRLRQADDAAKEKEAKGNADVPHRMRGQTPEE